MTEDRRIIHEITPLVAADIDVVNRKIAYAGYLGEDG